MGKEEVDSLHQGQKKQKTVAMKNRKSKVNEEKKVSRIVMGWSMPRNNHKHGLKPKCKGCGKVIERNEDRVRHRVHLMWDHKIKQADQFHLRASCLFALEGDAMKSFLDKKWSQKKAREVQATVAMTVASDDET